jgi:hypothetical protein
MGVDIEMNMRDLSGINRQKGNGLKGMIITLGVIVFAAYLMMNLLPVYTNHSSVMNAVNSGLDQSNLRTITRRALIQNMNQQLLMDGVYDLVDWDKALIVERTRQNVTVNLNYQRVVPLFNKISLLVSFDERFERTVD